MESVETPSSNPSISGSSGTTAVREVVAEVREGTYGDRVATIEPGGAGFITDDERHGKPINLFWTWLSPNLEFATIFVGVISILFFGLTFWQAVAGAIVLGTGLGAVTQASWPRAARARRPADDLSPDPVRLPRQHPPRRAQLARRGHRLVRRQQRQRRLRAQLAH